MILIWWPYLNVKLKWIKNGSISACFSNLGWVGVASDKQIKIKMKSGMAYFGRMESRRKVSEKVIWQMCCWSNSFPGFTFTSINMQDELTYLWASLLCRLITGESSLGVSHFSELCIHEVCSFARLLTSCRHTFVYIYMYMHMYMYVNI